MLWLGRTRLESERSGDTGAEIVRSEGTGIGGIARGHGRGEMKRGKRGNDHDQGPGRRVNYNMSDGIGHAAGTSEEMKTVGGEATMTSGTDQPAEIDGEMTIVGDEVIATNGGLHQTGICGYRNKVRLLQPIKPVVV